LKTYAQKPPSCGAKRNRGVLLDHELKQPDLAGHPRLNPCSYEIILPEMLLAYRNNRKIL